MRTAARRIATSGDERISSANRSSEREVAQPAIDRPLELQLIEAARRSGGHKTKKEAVTAALAEYVRRRKQLRILEAFGTFDFDPTYDYKSERRKGRS